MPRRLLLPAAGLFLAASASLAVPRAVAPARAAGSPRPVPITFSHSQVADVQRLAAEPRILVDRQGNDWLTGPIGTQYATSFLWKSEDGGVSFDLLRAFPPLQRPNPSAGTGDNEIVILPPAMGNTADAVMWSDMVTLSGLQNVMTFDGGNTFPPQYWNEFASQPGADRQWLAAMRIPGHRAPRIYQFYDDYGLAGLSVIYTDDYGLHWTDGQRNMGGDNPGNIATDPVHHRVWITWGHNNEVVVASGSAGATGFKPVVAARGKGNVATLFTIVAVDTAGNPYIAWTDDGGTHATHLTFSTDFGKTWRTVRVNPPGQRATAFPWVVAGDPGRVWVTYYGSPSPKGPPENRGPWNTYGAQSLNALDTRPRWRVAKISEHLNHDNAICLQGIACSAGNGEDRNMLDDFTAAIDPRGMLRVAYNDTNNQLGQSSDPAAGGAFILTVRQLSGPSLYRRVGTVIPRPPAPGVSSVRVANHVLAVRGRAALPPGNWSVDARGDARDPRHGMGGPGPNRPAMDLTGAWLSRARDGSLVAHLTVNRLPSTPELANVDPGKTVLYQVFFWVNGKVFFGALEADGTGTAYAGTPGDVPNQAGIAKIATYRPDPNLTQPTSFTWKAGRPGRITIGIPSSATGKLRPGTRLDQVTALVQTINGSGGNEQLMDERDATPGTSWRVGAGRRPGGIVEGSIDDPSFVHALRARFVRYPTTRTWTLSIPLSGLRRGRNTLYVRDRAGGFASRTIAVPFTVA